MDVQSIGGLLGGIAAFLALLGSWWRWGRPRWRRFWYRFDGMLDAVNGREEYVDPASGANIPALPPLTTRLALVETAIAEFRHNVALYTELAKRVDVHDARIKALEDMRAERAIAQAESAHMWRAVADRDLIEGDEDEPTDR